MGALSRGYSDPNRPPNGQDTVYQFMGGIPNAPGYKHGGPMGGVAIMPSDSGWQPALNYFLSGARRNQEVDGSNSAYGQPTMMYKPRPHFNIFGLSPAWKAQMKENDRATDYISSWNRQIGDENAANRGIYQRPLASSEDAFPATQLMNPSRATPLDWSQVARGKSMADAQREFAQFDADTGYRPQPKGSNFPRFRLFNPWPF